MIWRRRIVLLAPFAVLCVLLSVGAGAQNAPALDVERGRHIATALAGCSHCHGATFAGGRPFPQGAQTVYALNLTGGTGGIRGLTDADLRRAIRGGVRPDGTALRVMPSSAYAVMTDSDVNDVIAFLRSLPPVDNVVPRAETPPSSGIPPSPGALPVSGAPAPNAAEPRQPPLTGAAYLARIGGCTGCHGANLAGGERFGPVVAPNISHDGIGKWSFADFTTAMRTGKTPDGRILSTIMPWETFGKMTDGELRAVYDFLQSHPAQATN